MELKICGLRNQDDIDLISKLQIDYAGLIFAKSPRQVNAKQGALYARQLQQSGKKVVGVFVEETITEIILIAQSCQLHVIQVHRLLTTGEKKMLKKELPHIEIWQVVSVDNTLPKEMENIVQDIHLVLFDAKGILAGGNGIRFDWKILKDVTYRFGIAGGIDVCDMKKVASYHPAVIDMNSKLELHQQKDANKVKQALKMWKQITEVNK